MTNSPLETIKESVEDRMERAAEESIREIFSCFPFGRPVDLFTGKHATFKIFYEPQKIDGRWQFGIDLQFNDGSGHLEYVVKQTGYGGTP